LSCTNGSRRKERANERTNIELRNAERKLITADGTENAESLMSNEAAVAFIKESLSVRKSAADVCCKGWMLLE